MDNKVIFANNLRGIAALLVVASHFGGVFYNSHEAVHFLLQINSVDIHRELKIYETTNNLRYLNLGCLGVSLFFLISGFVIPFSLDKYPPIKFLINRFFRIYPTYWIGLGIGLVCLYINSLLYTSNFNFDLGYLMKQAFLVRDLFWIPSIDGVSWTLEIELKFYLIMLITYKMFKRTYYSILFSVLLLGFSVLCMQILNIENNLKSLICLDVPFFVFMFIGSVFNLIYKQKIDIKISIINIMLFFSSFVYLLNYALDKNLWFIHVINYAFSLFVFTICLVFSKNIKNSKLLNFLANISFPLYAVHALLGYSLLEYLIIIRKVDMYISSILVLVIVILVAFLIHILVELPMIRFAKNIKI